MSGAPLRCMFDLSDPSFRSHVDVAMRTPTITRADGARFPVSMDPPAALCAACCRRLEESAMRRRAEAAPLRCMFDNGHGAHDEVAMRTPTITRADGLRFALATGPVPLCSLCCETLERLTGPVSPLATP